MGIVELILLAVALSMDAFAGAVCKGLATEKATWRQMATVGAWFGGFQALMPLVGYFLGLTFAQYITAFDHWIAFALLFLIGGNMIREAFSEEEETSASFAFGVMLTMAVATSIDALAVGIAMAMEPPAIGIFPAVLMIGGVTFLLSALGFRAGNFFGAKYRARAEIVGGVILILLGTKILLEHLGVISF